MAGKERPKRYLRAAKFAGEESAGQAYFAIQQLLAHAASEVDLSVFRFIRNGIWHVAVVGDRPPDKLGREIESALAVGEAVWLERNVRRWLRQRRAEQSKRGPWVERHYRPGRGFRFGR